MKKSCGEHKSVWWKCRSGLALPNPKVSTSLVGGNGSIEQNGLLGYGGSSKGKRVRVGGGRRRLYIVGRVEGAHLAVGTPCARAK